MTTAVCDYTKCVTTAVCDYTKCVTTAVCDYTKCELQLHHDCSLLICTLHISAHVMPTKCKLQLHHDFSPLICTLHISAHVMPCCADYAHIHTPLVHYTNISTCHIMLLSLTVSMKCQLQPPSRINREENSTNQTSVLVADQQQPPGLGNSFPEAKATNQTAEQSAGHYNTVSMDFTQF